ncbi:Precorrin-2 dehydrogenase [Solibacillus isronensis B3W22]|uniref:precorrin-2 dehydrogenase n=1 Tax=Solibacillus isronensis B3W22 TaxID=1224748 RepID=K1KQM5_9BACL|nr:NAD(P)-dependent oxidoreductase [Solibacillus isronensis]AMO85199.1 siroheme synthase [Solibacillus silvestris]EKB44776.1 Precorrin-2 dehydrogenase [Solibacillus isronensis B3W22]
MNYFPLMVNIEFKKVVIIGGGHVARQKVEALLPTNAEITVVSPTVTDKLKNYLDEGRAVWKQKLFEPADLDGAALIFAATNDEAVNDAVEEATQHWQLLNRADALGRMDFMNPAVVRRGDFVVTVSTTGASPALTRKVKADLEEQYDESYAEYVAFLKEARLLILKNYEGDAKKAALAQLLEPEILDWIQQKNEGKCAQFLRQIEAGEVN